MNKGIRILIANFGDLEQSQIADWKRLHVECFKSDIYLVENILRKYSLNEGIFCLVYLDGVLAAAYSGLRVLYKGIQPFFLSTDTMSNGIISGGSIIAARELYVHLASLGFVAVCGFPNKKIEGLRVNKLGWRYSTSLNLYALPSFFNVEKGISDLNISRPSGGFFGRDLPFVVFGSGYKKNAIFRLVFSSSRPHWCSFNLSCILGFGRKRFYYKKLISDFDDGDLNFGNVALSSNSIDVP